MYENHLTSLQQSIFRKGKLCKNFIPEFDPDFIRSKSGAAAGLCSWVINVCKFYEVYCEVEPKRRALNDANQMLQDAQTRLSNLVSKVAQLEETLADLTRRYTVAVEAKVKCQQEADATGATISLANRLVGGLASEKVPKYFLFLKKLQLCVR